MACFEQLLFWVWYRTSTTHCSAQASYFWMKVAGTPYFHLPDHHIQSQYVTCPTYWEQTDLVLRQGSKTSGFGSKAKPAFKSIEVIRCRFFTWSFSFKNQLVHVLLTWKVDNFSNMNLVLHNLRLTSWQQHRSCSGLFVCKRWPYRRCSTDPVRSYAPQTPTTTTCHRYFQIWPK